MPTLQKVNVTGLWILGGRDKSIPVHLTIEMLDSLKAQGKDFKYIYYPNMTHGLQDYDTGGFYPVMNDALSWIEEKFGNRIK